MVLYALEIKVETENCQLIITGDNEWPLDLKQPNSDELKRGVIISAENEEKLQGGGAEIVNFIMKWPQSKQQCSIKVVDMIGMAATPDDWLTVVGFECRGVAPHSWNLSTKNEEGLGFQVTGESGDTFNNYH